MEEIAEYLFENKEQMSNKIYVDLMDLLKKEYESRYYYDSMPELVEDNESQSINNYNDNESINNYNESQSINNYNESVNNFIVINNNNNESINEINNIINNPFNNLISSTNTTPYGVVYIYGRNSTLNDIHAITTRAEYTI